MAHSNPLPAFTAPDKPISAPCLLELPYFCFWYISNGYKFFTPFLCKMEARLSLTVILIWAMEQKVSSMKDHFFLPNSVPSIRVLR